MQLGFAVSLVSQSPDPARQHIMPRSVRAAHPDLAIEMLAMVQMNCVEVFS
jgi:hypothetical protein